MDGVALKVTKEYLEAQGVKVELVKESILRVATRFEHGAIEVFLDFSQDTSVHFEGINFIQVPEAKLDSMYEVINDVNNTYRFVKFVLKKDHRQISAVDDAVIQIDSCGPECFELLIRLVSVVEQAYPVFMKAMWA